MLGAQIKEINKSTWEAPEVMENTSTTQTNINKGWSTQNWKVQKKRLLQGRW